MRSLCARHVLDPANPVRAIFLNTYFPPTTREACYQFARVRRREKSPETAAHPGIRAEPFPVDEEFDRHLKAISDKDALFADLRRTAHAAVRKSSMGGARRRREHLDLNWFEYVPGYRPRGTHGIELRDAGVTLAHAPLPACGEGWGGGCHNAMRKRRPPSATTNAQAAPSCPPRTREGTQGRVLHLG